MTTDTQPLAPTDAELDELRQANSGRLNFVTLIEFRTIARAVLAKWGAPQPVVRKPLTDEQVEALITTVHFREGYELKASVRTCLAWYRLGLRDGERAHGIKGGQHVGNVD